MHSAIQSLPTEPRHCTEHDSNGAKASFVRSGGARAAKHLHGYARAAEVQKLLSRAHEAAASIWQPQRALHTSPSYHAGTHLQLALLMGISPPLTRLSAHSSKTLMSTPAPQQQRMQRQHASGSHSTSLQAPPQSEMQGHGTSWQKSRQIIRRLQRRQLMWAGHPVQTTAAQMRQRSAKAAPHALTMHSHMRASQLTHCRSRARQLTHRHRTAAATGVAKLAARTGKKHQRWSAGARQC